MAANQNDGDDTVVFASGLSGTIALDGPAVIELYDSVSIQGPGADQITVNGDDPNRIFASTTSTRPAPMLDLGADAHRRLRRDDNGGGAPLRLRADLRPA